MTPPCGNLRPQPETSKNSLLVKTTLGTVKATTWDLPSSKNFQHEYGLRQHRDGITSADVIGGWMQHQGTGDLLPGRDFKALNVGAVTAGAMTSKDFSDFRATHDARLKLGTHKGTESLPYDETTRFGRSGDTSTPFNDLISHSYRFDWMSAQPSAEETRRKSKKPGQTKTSRMQAEQSALKRASLDQADVAPALWKMSSFDKVPSKLGYLG